jgi:ElaB/YqjD/DUF883 family membrane-anchored ribosome-binding protein
MQDLIKQLKDEAGLTEEQAIKSLYVIKGYIQSKVPPMMHGLIDNFLGEQFKTANSNGNNGKMENTNHMEDDFMDKAEQVTKQATQKIEGLAEEAKEEMEEFAKEASEKIDKWAVKAEEAAQEAINKLKDMINEQKHNEHKEEE